MNDIDIIKALQQSDFSEIYNYADEVRKENVGDIVHIRAILEFSNYCKRQCKYCGLNCRNTHAERYRMTEDEMIQTAKMAAEAGYKTLVMQSGEDSYFSAKVLGDIVKEIKKTGMYITLSCGAMSYDDYKYLKECGADRYLIKHETADKDLYSFLHPGDTLENRVKCQKDLKSLGYELGSGFMVGLPHQTYETLKKDLELLKELQCDMVGIGPFIPHPMTELKDFTHGSTELTKRLVALIRIILPKSNLPATTALNVLDENERNRVFSCGANVIMKKVTPDEYKKLYEIYPAKFNSTNIKNDRINLEKQIKELGRIPL